jgi:hypothetical protein
LAKTSGESAKWARKAGILGPSIERGQVVGRAGFLVESTAESSMVCPLENAVLEQADASFIGVERSGRN